MRTTRRPTPRRACFGPRTLIGQLADPFLPRKLNALFYEFEEISCNAQLGYASPADVADQYPRFFRSKVEPFIGDALAHLELTVDGPQWMTNLYCNGVRD